MRNRKQPTPEQLATRALLQAARETEDELESIAEAETLGRIQALGIPVEDNAAVEAIMRITATK